MASSERLALFPGSFDPFTLGHLDVLRRALKLFDHVEVLVAINAAKKTLLSLEERRTLILESTAGMEGVTVATLEGLVADHARKRGAAALVRGIRKVADFEYEQPVGYANRQLHPGTETVLLLPDPALAYISSSIVRDVHRWGGDISSFVPPAVAAALDAKKA